MRDETRADKRKETSERPTPINREQALQHSTSSSDHLMHDGAEMAMSHHHHGGHEMHAPSHEGHEMQMEMSMHSTIDLADPMSREGSGTSWIPDSSPMYGRMFMFGDNMLMLHGAIFPRYTNVSTRRGDDRIDAPNWFMAMFSHPLGESHPVRFALNDEPRSAHRRRTRLSASLSNRRIVERRGIARPATSARSLRRTFVQPLAEIRARSQRVHLFRLSG